MEEENPAFPVSIKDKGWLLYFIKRLLNRFLFLRRVAPFLISCDVRFPDNVEKNRTEKVVIFLGCGHEVREVNN